MSRFTDFRIMAPVRTLPSVLPPIDWASIGAHAPVPVSQTYKGPDAPLPAADIVMFTWTSAEWSAMDHVFLHGAVQAESETSTLIHKWLQYSKSAPTGSNQGGKLWGYYQLVDIQGEEHKRRVLLMKSDSHLAHPPWINGLEQLVKDVVKDTKAKQIYSIGTAGGASLNQRLGDVAITNSGKFGLELKENMPSGLNGKTVESSWFQSLSLLPKAQQLFFPLSKLATQANLASVLESAKNGKHRGDQDLRPFSLDDLLNSALDPANLNAPKAVSFRGTPLYTTDFYFITNADINYAALEMDDAVVGYAAKKASVDFVFVRNISDTLVPAKTPSNKVIPDDAREASWSSAIYDHYGLFTSFNGAIAAWATIAGS